MDYLKNFIITVFIILALLAIVSGACLIDYMDYLKNLALAVFVILIILTPIAGAFLIDVMSRRDEWEKEW
jgi:hypothetical protein